MSRAPRYVSFDSLKTALQPFIEGGKQLPAKPFFEGIHRLDLVRGIRKHGSWQAVRTKLGQPQVRRLGKDSYAIWNNAKQRLEELEFPPWKKLQKIDSALAGAIGRHHGGYVEAKRQCGKRVPLGWGLDKWENLEPLLSRIVKENKGDLPPADKLMGSRKPLYRVVCRAICVHHNGIAAVREHLGLKIRNFSGSKSLRHRENLDAILKPLVERLGYFPSASQLKGLKLQRITSACEIYHGGLNAVRRDYGYPPLQKGGKQSLRHWNNLLRELNEVFFLLGRFPTATDLRKLGKACIYVAMGNHHRGIHVVRKKFGVKSPYKRGFESLRFWENYLRELVFIVKELGHPPSQTELELLGRWDLVGAAKHHGGLRAVRTRFDESVKRREIRLEEVRAPEKKPAPDLLPSTMKLLDLLDFFRVEPKQIADNIIERIDGSFLLIPAPNYAGMLEPIPLHTREGVFAFDSKHAWLVSLFIQLSSPNVADRREAMGKVKAIMKSNLTQEKARGALVLLRNAFIDEEDKQLAREMEKIIDGRKAKPIWKSLADLPKLF